MAAVGTDTRFRTSAYLRRTLQGSGFCGKICSSRALQLNEMVPQRAAAVVSYCWYCSNVAFAICVCVFLFLFSCFFLAAAATRTCILLLRCERQGKARQGKSHGVEVLDVPDVHTFTYFGGYAVKQHVAVKMTISSDKDTNCRSNHTRGIPCGAVNPASCLVVDDYLTRRCFVCSMYSTVPSDVDAPLPSPAVRPAGMMFASIDRSIE